MTIPAIPTARTGQTTLSIPRIGLGTAPLAGTAQKAGVPVGQAHASAVIQAALEAGMGWFDTAPYYGGGLSETYLGTALTLVPRSRYVLSTKPDAIRELVLDDQRRRNDVCWSVFTC